MARHQSGRYPIRSACWHCSCAQLYLPMVCGWGGRVIITIDIPVAIWNFSVIVVIGTARGGAQLPPQEQHNPDHKRGSHDQWWSECCQVGEHANSFLPATRNVALPLAIVSHQARTMDASPLTGRRTQHARHGHGKI